MATSIKMIWRMVGLLLFLIMLMVIPAILFAEECPQPRKTSTAPKEFLTKKNPLPLNEKNLKSAEKLFQEKATPIACKSCHGTTGNGAAESDFESTPSPRNFTCTQTMQKLPDGQLFWIIKNGSKNTSMFAFSDLSDHQIWQLIHYIRAFAK
ncbi:MAG: c-type cytochrome [Nitrospinae bacterium]|nr:c-type cytochrome [Nitrospinota bacterium]